MFKSQSPSQLPYFDLAPVPMLLINEQGEIVHINGEGFKLLRSVVSEDIATFDGCVSRRQWAEVKCFFDVSSTNQHESIYRNVVVLNGQTGIHLLSVTLASTHPNKLFIASFSPYTEQNDQEICIDQMPMSMAIVNEEGRFEQVNSAFCHLVGYQEEALRNVKEDELSFNSDANSERPLRQCLAQNNRSQYSVEKRYIHKNGHHIWVRTYVTRLAPPGKPQRYIVAVVNIHEEKQLQEVISTSERRFRAIAENVSSVVWISAPDPMRLLYVNKCYDTVWEEPVEKLYSDPRAFLNRIHPNDRDLAAEMRFSPQTDSWSINYRLVFPDHRVKHVRDSGHCVYDGNGDLIYRVGTLTDITYEIDQRDNMMVMAKKLRDLVDFDTLTGIKSRHAIMTDVEDAYHQYGQTGDPSVLVYFDANGFKAINDTYGHEVGDRVLISIADHLSSNIRDTDVAGRIGGDEFVVLLRHAAEKEVPQILERLSGEITSPGLPEDVKISLSLGAVELTSEIDSAEQWLSNADGSMYENKRKFKRASHPLMRSV
ncbi:sensor domain-containing diguanylate cyclase [Enterovibrio coralii]|uniref:Diguanylate cyclase n=1 Tax=Enterovibrio coralii TaxID=294935 RepID=A0A135ICT5_9GAMM|nr:diguanylate cyclase [Enterovibrio coralii]KXF83287.1 diguanylate cyclase [Enterovibrio coralii]